MPERCTTAVPSDGIHRALKDWLANLQPDRSQLALLAAKTEELRYQGWPRRDILRFETIAHRILMRLLDDSAN
jgi:hypothetical protein